MNDTSSFYFALVRVSVIQSIGFDRASNTAIDILTDILIRHISLLIEDCNRLVQNSARDEVQLQDIVQSMVNLKIIKPSKINDPGEFGMENRVGMRNFVKWLKSDDFRRMQRAGFPTNESVASLGNGSPISGKMDWLEYGLKSQFQVEYGEKIRGTVIGEGIEKGSFHENNETNQNNQDMNVSSDYKVIGPGTEVLEQLLPYQLQG